MKICDICGSVIQKFEIYDTYGNTASFFEENFDRVFNKGAEQLKLKLWEDEI